jgi:hypothetical protein
MSSASQIPAAQSALKDQLREFILENLAHPKGVASVADDELLGKLAGGSRANRDFPARRRSGSSKIGIINLRLENGAKWRAFLTGSGRAVDPKRGSAIRIFFALLGQAFASRRGGV